MLLFFNLMDPGVTNDDNGLKIVAKLFKEFIFEGKEYVIIGVGLAQFPLESQAQQMLTA
jgi:hypothetical protein